MRTKTWLLAVLLLLAPAWASAQIRYPVGQTLVGATCPPTLVQPAGTAYICSGTGDFYTTTGAGVWTKQGGGGSSFDQDLNTTDSPTFAGLTVGLGNFDVHVSGHELQVFGTGQLSYAAISAYNGTGLVYFTGTTGIVSGVVLVGDTTIMNVPDGADGYAITVGGSGNILNFDGGIFNVAVFGGSNIIGPNAIGVQNAQIFGYQNTATHTGVALFGQNLTSTADNQTLLGDGSNPVTLISGGVTVYDGTTGAVTASSFISAPQAAPMGQHCTVQIDDAGIITKTASCS